MKYHSCFILKNKVFRILFLIFLASCQEVFSISVKEAESLTTEGRYREAYNMLNELNENTSEAFYLKGLCMYYLNLDLDDAVIFLTKSLTANGPSRIKLVLGLIYHRQYKTDEAMRMLREFLTINKNEADKELTMRHIEYCQNITAVAHRGKLVSVGGKTNIPAKDVAVQYNQQNINGIIIPKSFNLNNKIDEKNSGQNTLMVLPREAENIKYVFYTSFEPGRPDHTDIFRVKVLDNGEFSEPDNLGSVINTKQDEMYPYFDEKNQVLYFASKGHQSIGGFDIFMSYYNPGAESWSKPVNMGLPVNSSADDFLYVPMENENEYLFSTNREASEGFIDVIKLFIPPGAGFKTLVSQSEITAFNSFSGNIDNKYIENREGEDINKKNDPAYRLLLDKALNYQVKADSVNRKIVEQQQKIDVALGESRKAQLKNDLANMQNEYRKLKDQADLHYEAVREYERKNNIPSSEIQEKQEVEIVEEVYKPEIVPVISATEKPVITEMKPEGNNKPVNVTPVLTKKEYITSDDLPDGVVFAVQIGVYSKKMVKENFKGLDDIFYYFIPEKNLYKYYTGVYSGIDEARARLTTAKGSGFSDAFIAAFNSRKPVSISQAQEIQNN